MRDPNQHRATDEAALIDAMCDAWLRAMHHGAELPPTGTGSYPRALADRVRRLRDGRLAGNCEGDLAALALLQPPPDDADPVSDEDRAAMSRCTCGLAPDEPCAEHDADEVHTRLDGTRSADEPAPPCATCGGTREVTRGHQIVLTGRMWQEPCPSCAGGKADQ